MKKKKEVREEEMQKRTEIKELAKEVKEPEMKKQIEKKSGITFGTLTPICFTETKAPFDKDTKVKWEKRNYWIKYKTDTGEYFHVVIFKAKDSSYQVERVIVDERPRFISLASTSERYRQFGCCNVLMRLNYRLCRINFVWLWFYYLPLIFVIYANLVPVLNFWTQYKHCVRFVGQDC